MPFYKMNGKRDGKQKYRVRINYLDSAGKPHQIDRVTYGLEEAKLLELHLAKEVKEEAPAKRMTLHQLFDEYSKARKGSVRESTLDKSQRILKCHVLPELGGLRLHKLTTPVLMQWKMGMEQKGLAIATRQNAYAEFHILLNYACQMEYLPKNPLDKVGNFRASGEIKKEMEYYTADEFKKFIAVARENAENADINGILGEWDYYVFFAIAFYTGLRKGEIHGLEWRDIDGAYLSVKRSIAQKLKGDDRETAPKNKSSIRTLQIPAPLLRILDEHKARWKAVPGFTETYKVCGGTRSLRDTTIEKHNRRFAELAWVKKIRIHDFRHSHASLLANAGINIQEVARRLGHSRIEMTWNTYSHLYPKEEERAIKVLDEIV